MDEIQKEAIIIFCDSKSTIVMGNKSYLSQYDKTHNNKILFFTKYYFL